jgi:hypothetical protein
MVFCTQCGRELDDLQNFCDQCGAPVMTVVPELLATAASGSPVEAPHLSQESKTAGITSQGVWIAIVCLLLAVLAVGIVVANSHGIPHKKISRTVTNTVPSTGLSAVSFPLLVCNTTHGTSGIAPASLPATVTEMVPATYSSGLVAYTDDLGIMKVLAPKGWACLGGIGANGSAAIQVVPPGQNVFGGMLKAGSTVQEISASETSACVGCAESQACPLFTTAAHDYQTNYQSACPTNAPTDESINFITSHLVSFTDPPNVSGDASPSGGAYEARGVMTYDSSSHNGSYMETCVLPPTLSSLCSAILAGFGTSYG